MLRARTAYTFSTSNDNRIVNKWPEHVVMFEHFYSKCASRHNGVHFFILFSIFTQNMLRATTACTFSTSELPKSFPKLTCFDTFYFQMPERRALFPHLNHLNFQSRPKLTCFDTFYFHMCFAPQRRALFPHLNFQKPSEADVL